MKAIFKVSFYPRKNFVNKKGLTPIMVRISLNNQRENLGTTGIDINIKNWDPTKQRLRGRSQEVLETNLQLDNVSTTLQTIFHRMEHSEVLSLDRIKSEYLGKSSDISTILELFDKYIEMVQSKVGLSLGEASLQKALLCRKHFVNFLHHTAARLSLRCHACSL